MTRHVAIDEICTTDHEPWPCYDEYLARIVDQAPPFSPEQRAALVVLWQPSYAVPAFPAPEENS